jgi:steroid 5-alpha reductase family enzyme
MEFALLMLAVAIGINLLMFVPAFIHKTDKLTDISYAVTFVVVAIFAYFSSAKSIEHTIALVLISLWALRLGTYLFIRISRIKKDPRFDDKRDDFVKFLMFWLLQGTTVFVVLLPSIFLWGQTNTISNWLTILGIVVFSLGLIIEAIADIQKSAFYKTKPTSWIDVGIWRISRHPNYLGEILIWVGVYLFVAPSLPQALQATALVGPLFITSLLLFVSGIPLLEKSSDKKWGSDKSYAEYKKQVPKLIPSLQSIGRLFQK